ncbi:MAG: Uma2 family endonuclease [Planctomycetaceae bacterium]|nr:Uma2 family endonuclease [Planctomycetaceae bacterium]
MLTDRRMTAEEFADCRHELPEAGRWHELHEGVPVLMQPPDDSHGNAVLNLSRALAEWFAGQPSPRLVYACHQIGLQVGSDPDTVYFPAISLFTSGRLFAESDNTIATSAPSLVIDIASANDRRLEMRRRIQAYLQLGVSSVWVPDPTKKEVQVIPRRGHTMALGPWQQLTDDRYLPEFSLRVSAVFEQPQWWTGKSSGT